jgi:soluble lytic murein transglycosylase-like protein
VELNFNPAAFTEGRDGLMQLMPATAKQFGVDNPLMRPRTSAAAPYLRQLLDRYDGNTRLAPPP